MRFFETSLFYLLFVLFFKYKNMYKLCFILKSKNYSKLKIYIIYIRKV